MRAAATAEGVSDGRARTWLLLHPDFYARYLQARRTRLHTMEKQLADLTEKTQQAAQDVRAMNRRKHELQTLIKKARKALSKFGV